MFVTSPLDFAMLPAFFVLSVGQISVMVSSITLIGQEAKVETRGAVIAMNGFFGAIGILIAFAVGGRLFDSMGPSAPFVMAGVVQLVLFVLTIAVRVLAPGKEKSEWHS
jgi:predicted MFS family arabinose efflux permease